MLKKLLQIRKGFTLIELLIVIAILGVLAAVVLVAIDPIEQLARSRDSGRKSSISQVGHALQSYYTANGSYPAAAGWNTTLITAGEIKIMPTDPGGSVVAPACTAPGVAVNGMCYKVNATPDIVVYSHMESKSAMAVNAGCGVAANTWYVYSSAAGKSGIVCQAAEPAAGFAGTFY